MAKDNKKLEVEKLNAEIERLKKELKKRKKYGLVWEEKPEEVVEMCKKKLPVLKEVKNKEIITDKDRPVNLLIEGDNYHALSVLNYTHAKKVDVIYIDPPYNTGNKDFIFNDRYVDREDSYRHSKWLAFMEKRLKLAKNLLKDTGVIFISIDDNEVAQLKLLMDRPDLSGEKNKIGIFTIETPNQTSDANKIKNSDFLLVYSRTQCATFKLPSKEQVARCTTGKENQTQPVIEFPKGLKAVGVKDGIYKDTRKTGGNEDIFLIKGPIIVKNGRLAAPIKLKARWANPNDIKRFIKKFVNKSKEPVFNKFGKELLDLYFNGDRFQPQMVKRGFDVPYTILRGFTQKGGDLLKNILHKETLKYPKHPSYIKYLLSISANKNSVILDFMAGAGTTGQAVLELNKEDGGNRQFILCTNNQDENGGHKICTDICYPRIKKVIQGYKNLKGEKVAGLGGNLKYFKTDFVDYDEPTDRNKIKLTKQATEMLCVKEGTFEKVLDQENFKVFKNANHHTGIIWDQAAIPTFKKAIRDLNGNFSVYIFSLGDEDFSEEFADLNKKRSEAKSRTELGSGAWIKLSPIPEAILRVYRRIFK